MTGSDWIGLGITAIGVAAIWPHVRSGWEIRQASKEIPVAINFSTMNLTDRELLRYVDRSDYIQRELADRLESALDHIDTLHATWERKRTPEDDDGQECCF